MEFLASLTGMQSVVISTVSFLFIITVIVFFHELGHFMVARWVGVDVETFSVGFGREIVGGSRIARGRDGSFVASARGLCEVSR